MSQNDLQLKQLTATEQLLLENESYSDAVFFENKEYHLAAAITFSKLKVYWTHLYRYSKLYTWKFKINYFKIILFILTAD